MHCYIYSYTVLYCFKKSHDYKGSSGHLCLLFILTVLNKLLKAGLKCKSNYFIWVCCKRHSCLPDATVTAGSNQTTSLGRRNKSSLLCTNNVIPFSCRTKITESWKDKLPPSDDNKLIKSSKFLNPVHKDTSEASIEL